MKFFKTIHLPIAVTIVSAFLGCTWAIAGAYNMILDHEKKLHKMEDVPEDIAVIKNDISHINKTLESIDNKLNDE